ncbi:MULTISPECIES: Stk1 family PASTA domain-containing Ser/Thr kinase [Nocardiaceae]|uniref:non-specific serine/threonine protein kinase n=1 Tax=Rhodococcoides kroppenstedtii TaxID=293050 RepID=A0ABS7NUN5_9NOCA|nr:MULTISPECIES: Stk1 family PASTA domain-containing Ser/Thr kinase [Rhodococcus]AMY21089.1 Serine/threonine-protein kinase PknB [Rhodococcus sp. PBTS 1]MBY6313950.1 Stk1 family PASTA domain-containing Ser/Thr kinase [Rhodococcus kroppenstedtii]MBY6321723.1 Stk1 family PASTA domain-containing Ser/Thr kinase [Rhodococcus kroppenstedtii]MBY6400731.1 Stk1 family PASTA domain-containing Ser/Thr kinase [Rhodococcus kroppenstedtii]
MTTPRKLSARYDLGEILGFGGMSEVHLARDGRLDRDVAIKVLRQDLARDPTFYLRFRREAQNAAALNHPAIVAVYDTGEAETETGPLPYIVMEYVDGETLRDIVRSEGPMAPKRAMEVIADVCAALDFSHRNGIVHRDVKPANVMINRAGAVKVMDFGIARAIADSSSPMTQTAAVIGTAQYLSPEQARGEQVDARSDVYSLGCVLFEILTGEPPFTGDSPVAVAYQHVREDPRLPSSVNTEVPGALDSIILKAMSKNPANRYQSAADMRSDLIRVLGGQRPSAPVVMSDEDRTTIFGGSDTGRAPDRGPTDAPPPRATGRHAEPEPDDGPRSRVKVVLAAVAAIVVVGIVGLFLWNLGPGADPRSVTVPDVSALSPDDARTTLENAGFRVDVQQRTDPTVPEGAVIGTRPVSGTTVDENSTLVLELSTGPEQIQVPSLTGLTSDAAAAALDQAGLTLDPDVGRAASSRDQIDKVVSQEPARGSTMVQGSAVRITLGSGPRQIRVPDVVGQNIEVAQPNLAGAGFVVDRRSVDSARPAGEVVSTSPAGGGTASEGDTVSVSVSNGSQFTVPDITGQTPVQAVDTLRAAGWQGTVSDLDQVDVPTLDTGQVNRIQQQAVPEGQPLGKTARIGVSIGRFGI